MALTEFEDRPFGCPPDACSCGVKRVVATVEGRPYCRKCFVAWRRQQARPGKHNKYNAKKVVVGDLQFDSQAEAKRWTELKLLEQAGFIRRIERQVPYSIDLNGKHICKYFADFVYFEGAKRIVEDVKGLRTPTYRLKKKLVEAQYNVTIKEVRVRS